MDILRLSPDRYAQASTLSELAALLAEEIREHSPFDRMIVVGGFEEYVDAFGIGVPEVEVQDLLDEIRQEGGANTLSSRPLQSRLMLPEDPPLSMLRSLASPRLERVAASRPEHVGGVIVDAHRHHPALAAVRDTLRLAAPYLFRCAELDALRGRVRSMRSWAIRLRRTLDGLPDAVLVTDGEGRVLVANTRAENLLVAGGGDGLARGREVGLNNLRFSAFLARRALKSGGAAYRGDLTLVDPHDAGTELAFEVSCLPFDATGGDAAGMIYLLREKSGSSLRSAPDSAPGLGDVRLKGERGASSA
jgi:PAS domain-containing protein